MLEGIVRDLDAVIRAHVGGPVLGFEALPTTNGEAEVRLSCGGTRLRLIAAALPEREAARRSPERAALVVSLRAEPGAAAAVILHVDPVNRRWIVPEEPFAEHRLDDRAALETVLFSMLADATVRERELSGAGARRDADERARAEPHGSR